MSTIKISQLTEVGHLSTNTDNTLFVGVDLVSGITAKINATTIAEGLYSHNPLKVGNNEILFSNTVGQFSGNSESYLQVNLQNFEPAGSGDVVVTADSGSDVSNYIDMGINNSGYVDPAFSAFRDLDGYLYTAGSDPDGADGNLIIGTKTKGAQIKFIAGGTESDNIVALMTTDYVEFGRDILVDGGLVFADYSYQDVAAAPAEYTQAAFDKANTASSNSIYLTGALNQTNTNIISANNQMKSYVDGTNISSNTWNQLHYLANNTGTFNGSLSFTGNVNTNGLVNIINPNVTDNSVFLKITGAANGASQLPSNPGYTIHTTSIDSQGNRIVADAFGAVANNYASFIGRRGRGTAQTPSAVQNGDIIARFAGNGFGTTKFSQYGDGRIEIVANENFTDTSKRTRIDFYTTETGSNTANVIATFNGSDATFAGVVKPQKGFIYTPNTISSNVSSISLDMANNAVYKLSCNGNLNISVTGFQYGKVTEVWLTHYGNTNDTITHGCISGNATKSGTSFNVNIPTLIYLKYFSTDGDLANTYVSINYG